MLAGKYTPPEIREIANTAWGYRTRHGTPFGRRTIFSIFSNPFYHGVFEYPRGSDAWHTGRHTPMVSEQEFDTVRHLLSRSRRMPRNRRLFALTGLIRCGGCNSAVTAEEKPQLICSRCRFKFAHRSKEICPWCKLPIAEMKNPRELHYTYYHCTKSLNPACPERGIERKVLERQVIETLAAIRLPALHELWLNRTLGRLARS
jgi:site-specific DNA recombinase